MERLCAICKQKRQQCSKECVLTPYLPADKYACLFKVFRMSYVIRILNEIDPSQRQACVDSLCFEAEARIQDPVHGCVGIIHRLQSRIQQLELSLKFAKEKLITMEHEQNHQQLTLRSLL